MHSVRVHIALMPCLTIAFAYLCGSISFGLLYARSQGVDLRAIGSGNVGATNVGRALGKSVGRKVMVLDALKGSVGVAPALTLFGVDHWACAGAGCAAVLGHLFPVFFGFRGGKGAATAAGVLLPTVPGAGIAALVSFAIVKKRFRIASAASLTGALVGAAVAVILWGLRWPSAMAGAMVALVVWRHRDNLQRLYRGEEPPS